MATKPATDMLLLGTGAFAARIALDLAASARRTLHVVLTGRNAPRLDWLRTAANARAAIFGTPAVFSTDQADLLQDGAAATVVARHRPSVVVQAASVQTSAVIAASGDGWSKLVSEGGLSATAVFQAVLTARVARAVQDVHPAAKLLNCCFPDVVNGMIAAMGLPVLCGIGNVGILSNAFAGELAREEAAPASRASLRVLAHYQTLAAWRRPPASRSGVAPRVWLDGEEVGDVFGRFAPVLLTPEPAIEISGATGVPLMLAIAASEAWFGHVPGPNGLPGGYPVRWEDGALLLDLPPGSLRREDAIAWNARFEAESGLVLDGTRIRYTGRLAERLHALSPSLAAGFDAADLDHAYAEMQVLRTSLRARG